MKVPSLCSPLPDISGQGRRAAESIMRGLSSKQGLKKSLFLAFALTAGLSLAACSDLDAMLGDDTTTGDMAASDAPTAGSGFPATAAPVSTAVAGGAPVATITP